MKILHSKTGGTFQVTVQPNGTIFLSDGSPQDHLVSMDIVQGMIDNEMAVNLEELVGVLDLMKSKETVQ